MGKETAKGKMVYAVGSCAMLLSHSNSIARIYLTNFFDKKDEINQKS